MYGTSVLTICQTALRSEGFWYSAINFFQTEGVSGASATGAAVFGFGLLFKVKIRVFVFCLADFGP